MIAHYPHYQNPAVYRMQGRRWAREWAHKISRVPPEDLPQASVRTIESYRVEVPYLASQPEMRAALFNSSRYVVWAESAGASTFIDNEGRGWFAQPTSNNAPRINAPVDEIITVREPGALADSEYGRLAVGVVSKILTRRVGQVRNTALQDANDVLKVGLFVLTGAGEIRAWGDEECRNIPLDQTASSRLVSGVPSGAWEDMEVTTGTFSPGAGDLFAYTYAYAIRGGEVRTWGARVDFFEDPVVNEPVAATLNFPRNVMATDWRNEGASSNLFQATHVVLGAGGDRLYWVPTGILDDNTPIAISPLVTFASDMPKYYEPPIITFPDIPTVLNVVDIEFPDEPDPNKFLP